MILFSLFLSDSIKNILQCFLYYLHHYIATCIKHSLGAGHSNVIILLRVYAPPNSFDWHSNFGYLTDLLERHTNSCKRTETTERHEISLACILLRSNDHANARFFKQ